MFRLDRRELLMAAGAVGLSSVLAGCEKQPQSSSGNGLPLSLQSPWVNDAEFIGYFVAMAKNWYEMEGLSFRYLEGAPDKVADDILARGQCDVALTNPDGTFQAILKQGAPFKIIGTQYQKSPLGIVSLEENRILKPEDLIGKRLAVPDANKLTVNAFLRINKIDPHLVQVVGYTYDPAILTSGNADATVDFVTNVPYTIRMTGKKPTSFLLADHGFPMFMDTVVVHRDTLAKKRKELIAFLRASRRGWEENFKDVNKYPEILKPMMSDKTGRAVDNEKYFNSQQKPLIEASGGIFSMSEEGIAATLESLQRVGLKASRDVFVTDLLSEI